MTHQRLCTCANTAHPTHIVRDAHVDDAILADVLDQVVAVRVRHLVVVRFDFQHHLFGDFGEISDAFGVLGQHGRAA